MNRVAQTVGSFASGLLFGCAFLVGGEAGFFIGMLAFIFGLILIAESLVKEYMH